MFKWFSANLGGGTKPIIILFNQKAKIKNVKNAAVARTSSLCETLRNTRRITPPYNDRFRDQHRRRRRRTGDSIIVDSYRSRRRGPRKVPSKNPHRIRQHGEDRSPGECLLGSADRALAAAFQYWARHHASGADSRLRHPQEGLRAGESGPGQTSI